MRDNLGDLRNSQHLNVRLKYANLLESFLKKYNLFFEKFLLEKTISA